MSETDTETEKSLDYLFRLDKDGVWSTLTEYLAAILLGTVDAMTYWSYGEECSSRNGAFKCSLRGLAAVVVVGVQVQLLRNQVSQLLYCEMTSVPLSGNTNLTRGGAFWGMWGMGSGRERVGVKVKRVGTRVESVGRWEPCWHEGTCCVGMVLRVDN